MSDNFNTVTNSVQHAVMYERDEADPRGIPRPTVDTAALLEWVDGQLAECVDEDWAVTLAGERHKVLLEVRERLVPPPMPELVQEAWVRVFAHGTMSGMYSTRPRAIDDAAGTQSVGTVRLVPDETTWLPLEAKP